MSKVVEALRQAELIKRSGLTGGEAWNRNRNFRVITVASNKGGVGKTTIASNLAVYLRALREDDPVLVFGFDDQTTLERMFAIGEEKSDAPTGDIADGIREQSLARVASFGQYGVDYIPASRDLAGLRELIKEPETLRRILIASKRTGTVVVDTKSDFESPTCSAILASDLTVVVVKDNASLIEAGRTFDLLEKAGRPRESAKILLSLVDMRVKYSGEEQTDVLAHLIGQIRSEGFPLFETFISRSPKVESLYTNPKGRAVAILQGAKNSGVHRQMIQLTHEVAAHLDSLPTTITHTVSRESTATEENPNIAPSPLPPKEAQPPTPPAHAAPLDVPVSEPEIPRRPEPTPRKGPRFWTGLRFGNRN